MTTARDILLSTLLRSLVAVVICFLIAGPNGLPHLSADWPRSWKIAALIGTGLFLTVMAIIFVREWVQCGQRLLKNRQKAEIDAAKVGGNQE